MTVLLIIGLLQLPNLLGPVPCVEYMVEPAAVFSQPSRTSPRLGTLDVITPLRIEPDNNGCTLPIVALRRANGTIGTPIPTEEIEYELPAAVVHERSANWFRIGLDDSSTGWIEIAPDDIALFSSYEDLVTGEGPLPYLAMSWDGRLFSSPADTALQIPLPAAWRELVGTRQLSNVAVLENTTRAGKLWFRIRLGATTICDETPSTLPVIEAWIPAYTATGDRAVWFSSRGC